MKITVTTPCFNEIRFVRAWMENVAQFADSILISDGGSTDGTRDILSDWERREPSRVQVLDVGQTPDPQRYGYHEGPRRQQLSEMVTEGVQVLLDMDEMMPDDFRAILENCLPPGHMGTMTWLNFWRSPMYLRVGVPEDPHWGPLRKACVFPAGAVHWEADNNHARIRCELPETPLPGAKFHYHYLFARPKAYENRLAEMLAVRTDAPAADIRLRVVNLQHPRALRCLTEQIAFAALLPQA